MTQEKSTAEEEYQGFIATVLQNGLVWGLAGSEGWAVCPSIEFEDTDVFPFFSRQDLAQALCCDEWKDYRPKSLTLEEFLADWLPGMHEDNAMVGPDWSRDMEGLEVEPADLAARLQGT